MDAEDAEYGERKYVFIDDHRHTVQAVFLFFRSMYIFKILTLAYHELDVLAADKKRKLTALGVKWLPRIVAPSDNLFPSTDAPNVPMQDWEIIQITEV